MTQTLLSKTGTLFPYKNSPFPKKLLSITQALYNLLPTNNKGNDHHEQLSAKTRNIAW